MENGIEDKRKEPVGPDFIRGFAGGVLAGVLLMTSLIMVMAIMT